jgi:hypothetical protein
VEEIQDDDHLYRRLHPTHIDEQGIVSSAAFNDDTGDISVDLARLTTPEESVDRAKGIGYGLAELIASFPRQLGLLVTHDPQPDNDAHTLIQTIPPGNKGRRLRRDLARAATIIIFPVQE